MKTIQYKQPSFYHFSRDSVELAHYASEKITAVKTLLDCFAGCGVVGIEYALRVNKNIRITGVEKQKDFLDIWNNNMAQAKLFGDFICSDIANYKEFSKPDLILANPPYYFKGAGRVPEDGKKKSCHFMSQESWDSWKRLLIFFDRPNYFLARYNQPFIREDKDIKLEKKLANEVAIFSLR